jgi:hypothetical protein
MSAQQRIHLNPNAPRQQQNMGGMGLNQGMGMSMGMGSYTPDPISTRRGGESSGNEMLDRVKGISMKVEDLIEAYTQVSGV